MRFNKNAVILIVIAATFALGGTIAAKNNTDSAAQEISRQTKITMEQARKIALERASGKIESEELEKEHGKLIYSFDIRNAQGTITEVNVDAYTGAVIAVEEEDAQKEAAENQKEKSEKMQKKGDDDDEKGEEKEHRANIKKYSKQAKITMAQAKEIALKKVPGTITEEDLEMERGRLQYAFDIKDANGKVYDVEIDAKTGEILKAAEDNEDDDK